MNFGAAHSFAPSKGMMIRTQNLAVEILSTGLVFILLCGILEAQKQPPAKPIDLNAATIKELEELPGVGPVTAQRIIDARQKSGRFRRIEDLLAIRGISTKRLEALRPYVTVSPPPPAPAKKP
jgi:competence ComEA-like helix-hairpin-helix protein